MGGGNAKETNKMLGQQQQRIGGMTDTLNQNANVDRQYNTGTRDFVTDQYKQLYGGLDSGGGGGGGGYTPLNLPALRDNESMDTYREFMKNGGYNDNQQRDFRSRADAVIPAFFEGVNRKMDESANIRGGGYAGYSGQLAKMAREKAQSAEAGRLNSEVELQNAIRSGRLSGASGVERLDRERMSAEESRAREAQAQANAAAAASRGRSDNAFRDKMAILQELRDLRGESGTDLDYYKLGQNGMGMETNTITNRVQTPGALQQIGSFAGGLAGAATPFLGSGFLSGKKKSSNTGVSGGEWV